jgi:hypothetical protein
MALRQGFFFSVSRSTRAQYLFAVVHTYMCNVCVCVCVCFVAKKTAFKAPFFIMTAGSWHWIAASTSKMQGVGPTRQLSASMALSVVYGLLPSIYKWMRLTVVTYQLIYYCECVYRRLTFELRTAAVDCHVAFGLSRYISTINSRLISSDDYRFLTHFWLPVTTLDCQPTFYCEWHLSIVILHLIVGDAESYVIFSWYNNFLSQAGSRNTYYSRVLLCITICSS